MLESSSGKGSRGLGGHQAKHDTNHAVGSTRSTVVEGGDPSALPRLHLAMEMVESPSLEMFLDMVLGNLSGPA